MTSFIPHGDTRMEVQGRILIFRPGGPGNRQEIDRLLVKIVDATPSLHGSAWGALISAGEDHLLTPEAEARLQTATPKLVMSGQVATAVVAPDHATRSILQAQFQRMYEGSGTEIGSFASEDEAVAWLNGLIRSANHA